MSGAYEDARRLDTLGETQRILGREGALAVAQQGNGPGGGVSPLMAKLEPLLGQWQITSSIDGEVVATGRATVDWLEGGAYLVQRATNQVPDDGPQLWRDNAPRQTMSVIGADDATGEFSMLYTDSRGVARAYRLDVSDGTWRIWGRAPDFAQRFEASLSDDGASISGYWSISTDGETFAKDFDIEYTKLS
jgi:hypothetical protein